MDKFLGCDVVFGADTDEVAFPGTANEMPVVHADPYLNKLLIKYAEEVLAAVKNHTFFGDGRAKGGLGEMASAAVGTQSRVCIPVNRGSAGNPPCDAPSGWTATERARSADLAVLSTVTSRTKR